MHTKMKDYFVCFEIILGLIICVTLLPFSQAKVNGNAQGVLEFFYRKEEPALQDIVQRVNAEIDCGSYVATVHEYIVDRYTGIGMVMLSVSREDYEHCAANGFFPHVEGQYLMGERSIETRNINENVYFFYCFVLNQDGLKEENCRIYLNIMEDSHFYDLRFSDQMDHKVLTVAPVGEVTMTPFGFALHGNSQGFDQNYHVDFENVVGTKYTIGSGVAMYSVYFFQVPVNCEGIHDADAFIELVSG